MNKHMSFFFRLITPFLLTHFVCSEIVIKGASFDSSFSNDLKFKFEMLPPASLNIKSAYLFEGEKRLESEFVPFSSNKDRKTAIHFLIDVSLNKNGSQRSNQVQISKDIINKTLESFPEGRYEYQISAIGYIEPTIVYPFRGINGNKNILAAQKFVNKLTSEGQTTQGYKLIKVALNDLESVTADRKYLVLFSDGEFEDVESVHNLPETIDLALKNKVSIITVGFAKNSAQANALQPLEKLSQDTQGFIGMHFASKTHTIKPVQFASDLISSIESGGFIKTNATAIAPETETLSLKINDDSEPRIETVKEISIKELELSSIPTPVEEMIEQPVSESTDAAISVENDKQKKLPIPLMVALTILVLLIVGSIILLISKKSSKKEEKFSGRLDDNFTSGNNEGFADDNNTILTSNNSVPADTPKAWLKMIDATSEEHLITIGIYRIGRSRENDLHIENNTISKNHCVIKVSRSGEWSITDLESGNAVLVNGNRQRQTGLRHGDEIELGEVKMRFLLSN